MKFEEVLPEFRKGAKIRCERWSKEKYIYIDDYEAGVIRNEKGESVTLPFFFVVDIKWELYQEPEPDWEYIIKNKCLCWFWDDSEKYGKYSRLVKLREKKFVTSNENGFCIMFKNCRPVRKDEITFYEDKEDEDNS